MVSFGPAPVVLEDSISAGPSERIGSQVEILIVGGDSRIANQHGLLRGSCILQNTVYTKVDSLTGLLAL